MDVASLADLLHETAEHHDPFEKASPPHDWWDWYAAYMDARQSGSAPEEASDAAGRYMAEVKQIVVGGSPQPSPDRRPGTPAGVSGEAVIAGPPARGQSTLEEFAMGTERWRMGWRHQTTRRQAL
jgi:hypothetical protein